MLKATHIGVGNVRRRACGCIVWSSEVRAGETTAAEERKAHIVRKRDGRRRDFGHTVARSPGKFIPGAARAAAAASSTRMAARIVALLLAPQRGRERERRKREG